MIFSNISEFINREILFRHQSLFEQDLRLRTEELSREIKNSNVLVIGGAGTIGSSFIKSLLNFDPAVLVIIDTNENALTELTRDLRSSKLKLPKVYLTYPMNFSSQTLNKVLKKYKYDIVANFAAHKHVRSEKDVISIESMIENNVLSAEKLLKKLTLSPPKHFFCVSTDKAANPVNIMGASKKLMEYLILAYSSEIKITTARFANVAFSNGSLLDGFINRMIKRQPISCPSNVYRYFVSPEESGQICLLACILGKSGEIFFPKLDKNSLVNFKDITERYFKFLNLEIDYCSTEKEAKEKADILRKNDVITKYPVYFFESDTSGEKLYEEFYEFTDEIDNSSFQNLGIIVSNKKYDKLEIELILKKLSKIFLQENSKKSDVVNVLGEFIPNFSHIETGKSLDQKM